MTSPKYVGICGLGSSDHFDFAQWLVETGIQTLLFTRTPYWKLGTSW